MKPWERYQKPAEIGKPWEKYQPAPQSESQPIEQPAYDPSAGELPLQFAVPFMDRPIDTGITMPEWLSRAAAGTGSGFNDMAIAAKQMAGQDVAQQVDEKRRLDKPLMDTTAGSFGRGIAYAAPVLGAPFTAGGALGSGVVMGALEPRGSDEGAGQIPLNMAETAGGNLLGLGVGKGIGKVLAPLGKNAGKAVDYAIETSSQSKPYKAAVDLLKKNGITLNAAQETGNEALKNLWRALGQHPLTSGFVQADRNAQAKSINSQVAKALGVSEDHLTPNYLEGLKSVVGGKIGDITEGVENIPLNKQFFDELKAAEEANSALINPMQNTLYGNIRDDLLQRAIHQEFPGKVAQTTQSNIGAAVKGAGYQEKPLIELRKVLNNAIDREANNPELAKARAQYSLLSDLMPRGGSPRVTGEGNVIPAQLVKAMEKGGKRGDLLELMRAARLVLPEAGSSNTSGQQAWLNMLRGGLSGYAGGGLLGAGIAGYGSGFDPLTTAKGFAVGAAPKTAYKLLSTNAGGKYLTGGLRNSIPDSVDTFLSRLMLASPTAAIAGNRPK